MVHGFVPIERIDDQRLAQFRLNERGLANRGDKRDDAGAGLFLAEGDLVVGRALDAGCRPVAGLADGRRVPPVAQRIVDAGGEVYVGGEHVRRLVTGLGTPQSIVALFHRPPRPSAQDIVARSTRLVIVEGVDNPGNVGSIVRNAAAFGWDGLLLDHTSADPLARRALRVAMGTAFTLPHARTRELLDVLRDDGRQLYALTPGDGCDRHPLDHTCGTPRRRHRIGTGRVVRRDPGVGHAGAHPDGGGRRLLERRRRGSGCLLRARLSA